jgi:hypothetical protein
MRTPLLRLTLAASLVGALAVGLATTQRSEAHHSAIHNQNPTPAAKLGATRVTTFEKDSIVIPMDACYQRHKNVSDTELQTMLDQGTPARKTTTIRCQANNAGDMGIIKAYSLAIRLARAGIPVHWAIAADGVNNKANFHAEDFKIQGVASGAGATPPAWTRKPGAAKATTTTFANGGVLPYRGAPFVIRAIDSDSDGILDTTEAITEMNRLVGLGGDARNFTEVDFHIARTSFTAPIYRTITGDLLPKLALVDTTDAAANVQVNGLQQLKQAVLDAMLGDMPGTADDLEGVLYDWVSFQDVIDGKLATQGYDLAWVPSFARQNNTNIPRVTSFFNALAELADAGGSVVFQEDTIEFLEGIGTWSSSTFTSDSLVRTVRSFIVDLQPADTAALIPGGIVGTWGSSVSQDRLGGEDFSDPVSQCGGLPWMGVGGARDSWKPRYDRTYLPGTRRMVVTDSLSSDTERRWDLGTWRHKDNDLEKGRIYYLGGDNWRQTTASGFRLLLNTVLTSLSTDNDPLTEVSRSSPVVAPVGGTEVMYQGTFETAFTGAAAPTYASAANAATFEFPYVKGHLRGLNVARLAAGETSLSSAAQVSGLILFDAANGIPPVNYVAGCGFPANGTCRRIFTNTGGTANASGTTANPAETLVVQNQRATLKPFLGPTLTDADINTLISRIHAGRKSGATWVPALGGIDRSTLAVIEPSPLVSNGRPTMLYFGGLDGMLHAVCASTSPYCPAVGTELWAFMPKTELSKVRSNATRLDGSPKVVDVFGTFPSGTGYRTVLTFQTGNNYGSATYALDITNPASPDVLWELSTPGPGISTAMGWVVENASIKPWTFVQTSLGSSASGFEVRAVDTVTGEVKWTWSHTYPDARNDAHDPPPTTAMPGGVSIVANESRSLAVSLLVPSLWGAVYKLDPETGVNQVGQTPTGEPIPLFKFGDEDFHPVGAQVAVYRTPDAVPGNSLRALAVTGGFVDPFAPTSTVWAPDTVNQYALGFPVLDDAEAPYVFNSDTTNWPHGLFIDFGAGQRAFSPAVVAGNDVFVTTDSSNVNAADFGSGGDTGKLWRRTLAATGTATSVVIPSGAASVDVSTTSGAVLAGGVTSVVRNNPVGFNAAAGQAVEVQARTTALRRMWLRMF